MNLLKAIATVSGLTTISRVLGFVRDILVAAVLGAGFLADVFFVAFKLPNLFRRMFAEGAFTAAFVPQFSRFLEERGSKAAQEFAEQALAVLLWSLLVFVLIGEMAMPWLVLAFAPGFLGDPDKLNLAVLLSRITFPYLLFISIVSLMSGVLNCLGRFAAAAATPIILNICLITAILWLANYTPSPAHGLAWGVTVAGSIQLFWLLFNVSSAGFGLRLFLPKLTPAVKILARRIFPVAIGAGVYQISLLVDTVVASLLPTGSISYLFFADRVNQLPMGVVGIAVGTALLPMLSRQLRSGDVEGANFSQNRALEFSLLLSMPAAVALIIISTPVISVLFERGAFGPSQTIATAQALGVYAIGLPAYVLVKVLTPAFFSREDTSTPVKIGFLAVSVNLILNLLLMGPLLHVGIAAATAFSGWLNAFLLAMTLFRRGHLDLDARLKRRLPRILLASMILGVFLGVGLRVFGDLFVEGDLKKFTTLGLFVLGGLVLYGFISFILGTVDKSELQQALQHNNSVDKNFN